MSYYEDDSGSVFEEAYDAGFWSPDDIDELRDIVARVGALTPAPGDRAMAALILLNEKLNAPQTHGPDGRPLPVDPFITWAETLLKDKPDAPAQEDQPATR